MKNQKKPPPTTGPTVVVFGTERHASVYAARHAMNPRKILLAANGADNLRGVTSVIAVRYPADWWEPWAHPCVSRVRDVEDALKRIKQTGGDVLERFEQ